MKQVLANKDASPFLYCFIEVVLVVVVVVIVVVVVAAVVVVVIIISVIMNILKFCCD